LTTEPKQKNWRQTGKRWSKKKRKMSKVTALLVLLLVSLCTQVSYGQGGEKNVLSFLLFFFFFNESAFLFIFRSSFFVFRFFFLKSDDHDSEKEDGYKLHFLTLGLVVASNVLFFFFLFFFLSTFQPFFFFSFFFFCSLAHLTHIRGFLDRDVEHSVVLSTFGGSSRRLNLTCELLKYKMIYLSFSQYWPECLNNSFQKETETLSVSF
jgi:hypothetical protein